MSEIGEFLKKLRVERRMTYREAAEKSGLSHSYIRYLEKGRRPGSNTPINPSPESLRRLADAYRYEYSLLMKMAGYVDDDVKLEDDENKSAIDLITKYRIFDLSDDELLNIPMYYEGMELTKDEKREFLAIVRGIFAVRKQLKENQ